MSVTLLFTDIEGSTRLVQQLGDAYPATLEAHRAKVRAALAAAGGDEVDCHGDEFSAAFADADAAVAAARAIQRDHEGDVRVRIGIHTGAPLRIEGGYVGLDVHRAARICAAGHGGQVLLSETSHAALRDADGLRDLGFHRLRGLDQPERIYQLDGGLFPALRADAAELGLGARIRVVIAEDSILLREGVARLLEDAGFQIVAQAGDADELLASVRAHEPDIAIVDVRMPPTHTDEGLRAAQEIRERHPGVGVLVLSQYVETGYALELLHGSCEGVGYLLKDRVADVKEFASAVKRVAEGGSALDPEMVGLLVARRLADESMADLSPVEREVLELMAEGRLERRHRRAARPGRGRGRGARLRRRPEARAPGRRRGSPARGGRARRPARVARGSAAQPAQPRPARDRRRDVVDPARGGRLGQQVQQARWDVHRWLLSVHATGCVGFEKNSCGLPHDQLRGDGDVGDDARLQVLDQVLGEQLPREQAVLADRGQRRVAEPGERDVVVADHRDVVRDAPPRGPQRVQRGDRDQVAVREDGVQIRRGVEQAAHAGVGRALRRRPPDVLDERRVGIDAGLAQRRLVAAEAVGHLRVARRAAEERDALAAGAQQVLGGELSAREAVSVDRRVGVVARRRAPDDQRRVRVDERPQILLACTWRTAG